MNESDTDSDSKEFVDAFDKLNIDETTSRQQTDEAVSRQQTEKPPPTVCDQTTNEKAADDSDSEHSIINDPYFIDEKSLAYEDLSEEEISKKHLEAKTLKEQGNDLFKDCDYESALNKYSDALRICPLSFNVDRSVLYSNRSACLSKLDDTDYAIKDCTKSIELNPTYVKAILRRAILYEQKEKLDEALKDYQSILEIDPGIHKAREACMRLPEQIKIRNEKMKEEMMGKLKDLGNLVLKPFGLSTNNFKLTQDPKTGGYSVNFQQNAS